MSCSPSRRLNSKACAAHIDNALSCFVYTPAILDFQSLILSEHIAHVFQKKHATNAMNFTQNGCANDVQCATLFKNAKLNSVNNLPGKPNSGVALH